MSWYGSELTTVMFTSPGATPSSLIRRAAPSAAHRPANPDPSTTTSLTGLTLAARYPRYGDPTPTRRGELSHRPGARSPDKRGLRPISASRSCRLFRDCVQCCSGLVDLVVCVGNHGGGGHRLTLVGERFVSLVAEHIAQMGDRGGELG